MNTTRPEAESEYSRAREASNGVFGLRDRVFGGRPRSGALSVAGVVLLSGLAGSALLLAAQFTPLLTVHSSAGGATIKTIQTGSHDSYALVPVALLGALLSFEIWRTRSRLAMLAIGLLGILTLTISLLRDLPAAQATGVVGSLAAGLRVAGSRPAIGLYLETLGGTALLVTAVAGLLLLEPRARPGAARGADLGQGGI